MKKNGNNKGVVLFMMMFVIFTLAGVVSCTTENDEPVAEEEQQVELTQAEKDMLLQMREEEKLAHDVYVYMYNLYGLNIFNNISNSEQIHMGKVLELLNKYGLEDPALPNPGEFSSQELQDLYNQLIAQGEISLIDALKVGATIEDLDIYDLEEFSTQTENSDILAVFDNLSCGSRNHMRGFYNQLTNNGATYTPQFISQQEYDDIVNSPHENCN